MAHLGVDFSEDARRAQMFMVYLALFFALNI